MGKGPGTLTLSVKPGRENKSVIIQIADSGHGIPTGIMDRVFEPFFTTRDTGENTGLGLAVCHGIIENHRGSITLHSTEGEGTTCTITLPGIEEFRAAPEKESAASTPIKPAAQNLPAVLIADADEEFRQVMRAALQSRGYMVRLAEDALECVASIMGHPVDAVLLDLRLPALEGVSLTHELCERFPAVPIIVTAPLHAGDETEELLRAGARACLRKPFEIERLLHELQKIHTTRSNVA